MADFSDRVVLVTGGTGGLGQAVVRAFLQAGAHVDVPFIKEQQFNNLQTQLGSERLSGGSLDLTDEQAVAAYYEALGKQHGGIDVLVNVAGAFAGGKPVHETAWDLWQQQLDINLKTAVLSCHAAVPLLLQRGGGAIINVSSRTATQNGANLAAYAASKRALLQLTEALAAELREQDITANAILPSTIDTPTNRKAMPKSNHSRWVDPADIAKVVLFLAGPDARIISGASVPVYGKA
jgi:NAD(P)-dependent dehydrogenase (short-subunit alcohol dehydrogenase family)